MESNAELLCDGLEGYVLDNNATYQYSGEVPVHVPGHNIVHHGPLIANSTTVPQSVGSWYK